MSKRFHRPYGYSDSKKPRLEISISKQFLPLSQNTAIPSSTRGTINDTEWGDDNDDEILLQVSQAYEEVSDVDTSALPDYSICMKPRMTSTQLSTINGHSNISKFEYLQWGDRIAQQPLIRIPARNQVTTRDDNCPFFKKPSTLSTTNHQLPRFNGSSSNQPQNGKQFSMSLNRPPQLEPEVTTKGNLEACKQQLDEDKEILEELGLGNVSINDNNQCILKQVVELRKQNVKFKMEQNKLLDRCVTKEGEVSILRAQLKSAAAATEAARLQRLEAHERFQRQWSERLNAANADAKGLQAELEFKNMEISKVKEKCKQLEISKIKSLPKVTPREVEKRGYCQILSESFAANERIGKRICTKQEANVQTDRILVDERIHVAFMENYTLRDSISETIFDSTSPEKTPFLCTSGDGSDYTGCSLLKRKLLNVALPLKRIRQQNSDQIKLHELYVDLAHLLKLPDHSLNLDECPNKCLKIGLVGKDMLAQAKEQMQTLSNKIDLSMIKKMDELYLQYTNPNASLNMDFDLFSSRMINPQEQCVELRRILAVVAALCPYSANLSEYVLGLKRVSKSLKTCSKLDRNSDETDNFDCEGYLPLFLDLCKHIGNMGCANAYSGVLSSFCQVLYGSTLNLKLEEVQISAVFSVIKELGFSRPPADALKYLLRTVSSLSKLPIFLNFMCEDDVKPLKIDLSQGVITYTKDNCFVHILCSQVEVWLKQLEVSQEYVDHNFEICHHLLSLAYNSSLQRVRWSYGLQDIKCHCPVKFVQSVCLALKLCVKLYKDKQMWKYDNVRASKFRILFSEGLMMLYLWSLRDVEFLIKLGEYEGYYQMFVETCKELEQHLHLDNIHAEALADLSNTLESCSDSEEQPSTGLSIWQESWESFHLTD